MLHAYRATKHVLVTVGAVVCCLDIGFRHITAVPTGKYTKDELSLHALKLDWALLHFFSASVIAVSVKPCIIIILDIPFKHAS